MLSLEAKWPRRVDHACYKAEIKHITGMLYVREINYSNTNIRYRHIHVQYSALGHIQIQGYSQYRIWIQFKNRTKYMSTRRSGKPKMRRGHSPKTFKYAMKSRTLGLQVTNAWTRSDINNIEEEREEIKRRENEDVRVADVGVALRRSRKCRVRDLRLSRTRQERGRGYELRVVLTLEHEDQVIQISRMLSSR